MFAYTGHIVTLIAALVAVFGDTWDPKESGVKRLTVTGKIAVLAIVGGFTISSISTYREQHKERELNKFAAEDIETHWRALVYPFTLILWDVYGQSFDYSDHTLKKLTEADAIKRISSINIRAQAPHYSGMWLSVISDSTKSGRDGLNLDSVKYNFVLDEDLIAAIHKVTRDYYTQSLISAKAFGETNPLFPNDSINTPMPLENLADTKEYREYIKDLTYLKEQLDTHLR